MHPDATRCSTTFISAATSIYVDTYLQLPATKCSKVLCYVINPSGPNAMYQWAATLPNPNDDSMKRCEQTYSTSTTTIGLPTDMYLSQLPVSYEHCYSYQHTELLCKMKCCRPHGVLRPEATLPPRWKHTVRQGFKMVQHHRVGQLRVPYVRVRTKSVEKSYVDGI
eukprot:jgi/Botrbrau1/11444/Bobra.0328s0004.1